MPKYRKKPIVIEAIKWTGENWGELADWASVPDAVGGVPVRYVTGDVDNVSDDGTHRRMPVFVHTLEGDMRAELGDYIIKGVAGEFYPCKPGIFEKTYELVDDV